MKNFLKHNFPFVVLVGALLAAWLIAEAKKPLVFDWVYDESPNRGEEGMSVR